MINLLLILYFALLSVFLFGAFAVLYHILVHKLNERISIFTAALFIVGSLIFISFNVSSAVQVEWSELSIDLSDLGPGLRSLENNETYYGE